MIVIDRSWKMEFAFQIVVKDLVGLLECNVELRDVSISALIYPKLIFSI